MKLDDAPLAGGDAYPTHSLTFTVNGRPTQVEVEPWVTLLDLLRERLDLTGTKKGCDHGQCGACTVQVDGRRVNSCLTLAVMQRRGGDHDDRGPGQRDGALHPMQQAFIDHDALQCGYCTPGQICLGRGDAEEGHARRSDDIREQMSGNLCRCGAYANIVAAIAQRWSPMNRFRLRSRRGRWLGAARRAAGRLALRRRRHQPRRPDEAGRRAAGAARRHHRARPRRRGRARRRRPAHRRPGPQRRPGLASGGARALPAAVAGAARRRVAAAAQRRHDRRQPAAAHPLPLLLRARHALQQARAGQRLLGDRRRQPDARHPRRQRVLHRRPSVRHVRRAGGARRGRRLRAIGRRRASASPSPISTGCPATRPSATPCSRPASSSPRSSCRRRASRRTHAYIKLRDRRSYAFALVSVAAALELEATASASHAWRSAGSPTSPGESPRVEQAMAGPACATGDLGRGGRRRSSKARSRRGRTASRSSWRGGPSCAPSSAPRGRERP